MTCVHLVIDESGAKGYSDNNESKPGELGVMVGYLVPDEHITMVEDDFNALFADYHSVNKMHITDLDPRSQDALRKSIFEYFAAKHIYWVYEAIYVQGYHDNFEQLNNIISKLRSSSESRIKVSWRKISESLHCELFSATFGKAVAVAVGLLGNDLQIKVTTDPVDMQILKRFENGAHRFLNVGKPKCRKVSGYDSEQKRVLSVEIRSEVTSGLDVLGDLSAVSFSVSSRVCSLTLAADILANSVHHHLMTTQGVSLGSALNAKEAIAGHPLETLVCGEWEVPDLRSFSDGAYAHPNSLKSSGDERA